MNNLVENAISFADRAHRSIGQTRKYTGEPYINHPLAMIDILRQHSRWPVSDAQLAAAALHDTVEDTPVTLDEVRTVVGEDVATLVDWLTDVSKPQDGNRRTRKALDLAHTAAAPPEAKTVKLADLIHNAVDITQHDPDFARVWLREKAALLEVLSDGDPGLLELAHSTLSQCRQQLKEHK